MNEQESNQWRELGWRRKLSPPEVAALQEHLAAHPADREIWESEAALNQLLERLPEAPRVSSNFTARVLKAVELEIAAESREHETLSWLQVFRNWLPRIAVASIVVSFLVAGYHHQEVKQERTTLARNVAGLAEAVSSDPELMKDFEPIRRLSEPRSGADTELLALMK